jgi:hypothetical protein
MKALRNTVFLLQIAKLRQGEQAIVAGAQAFDRNIGEVRSCQTQYRIANRLAQSADLSVFPLLERQLQPSLAVLDPQDAHIDGLGGFAVNNN